MTIRLKFTFPRYHLSKGDRTACGRRHLDVEHTTADVTKVRCGSCMRSRLYRERMAADTEDTEKS